VSPQKQGAGPRQTGPTRKRLVATQREPQSIPDIPTATAVRYMPSGRRRLPLDVVVSCPFCPWAGHVRRAGKSPLRRAGCCSKWYLVEPTVVRAGRVHLEVVG
jgi:hypothetical protein